MGEASIQDEGRVRQALSRDCRIAKLDAGAAVNAESGSDTTKLSDSTARVTSDSGSDTIKLGIFTR